MSIKYEIKMYKYSDPCQTKRIVFDTKIEAQEYFWKNVGKTDYVMEIVRIEQNKD